MSQHFDIRWRLRLEIAQYDQVLSDFISTLFLKSLDVVLQGQNTMVGIMYIICNGSVLLTNGPFDVPLSGQPCDVSFAHHKVRVRLVNVDLAAKYC